MATEDESVPIPLPPGSGISFSQRPWSVEVALAAAIDGQSLDTREVVYEFSNGRRFVGN